MLRRVNAVLAVLTVALSVAAGQAAAATVIPVTPTQKLTVRVPAQSLPVYKAVEVYLETCTDERLERLGSTTTNGEGGARFTLTVPADTEPGCYQARFVRGPDSAVSERFLVRDPQVVRAGQKVTVSVPADGHFDERPYLEVVLETCSNERVTQLGHVNSNPDGSATFTFVVPRGTAPGCYHVRFISAVTSAFTVIQVRAARGAARPARPALPATGADAVPLAGAGGLLVGAGLLALVAGRRRPA